MQNLSLTYYVVCNLAVSVKCHFQLDSLNGDITRTEDCYLFAIYLDLSPIGMRIIAKK